MQILRFWTIYDLEDDTDPLGAKILHILLLISILGDLVYMIFFRNHICVKLAVDYSKIHDSTTIVAFRTMTYVYVCLYRRLKRIHILLFRSIFFLRKRPTLASSRDSLLFSKCHSVLWFIRILWYIRRPCHLQLPLLQVLMPLQATMIFLQATLIFLMLLYCHFSATHYFPLLTITPLLPFCVCQNQALTLN